MQKVILVLLFSFFIVSIPAQTPTTTPAPAIMGIKANLAAGEVSAVNTTENKISLQTTDGPIEVIVSATTVFKRVPPENPVLTAAVASSLAEIGEKDKIVVTGVVSADKKTIPAKTVLLMTKSDISKRNQAERELWRTRGISGKVVSVDFKTQNVTISMPSRGMAPASQVVLSPKENAEYLRYSADSIKFSDAVASSLAEIKVGDELRALGEKSPDGLTFKAEKYLTGSFKQVTGKVTAIDVAKNEITIENTQDKKPVIVVVKGDTWMKKFPAEMAQMMATAMSGGGGMQPPTGGQGGNVVVMRPPQGNQTAGTAPSNSGNASAPNGQGRPAGTEGQPGQGGRQFTRGGRDLEDILNNQPNISMADIKVGDTIGISATAGNTPNRYTAAKLISGIEPFLAIPQRQTGGGPGSQSPTINIPGLDGGIGTP
jgi:hypothetical protein